MKNDDAEHIDRLTALLEIAFYKILKPENMAKYFQGLPLIATVNHIDAKQKPQFLQWRISVNKE